MTSALRTVTLAEIYARQGHLDEACEIYSDLVAMSPGDRALAARWTALREQRCAQQERESADLRVAQLRTMLARVRRRSHA